MSQSSPAIQRLRPFRPTRFGRYTLLLPLASGGIGEVFLARLDSSEGFEKLCVIKKILPSLSAERDFLRRFAGEAQLLVQLNHGSIAQVLDMGSDGAMPYIAFEFVDGKNLRRLLDRVSERQLRVPLPVALYTGIRVLDALAYAHRKRDANGEALNLVHRDISPQNVILSYEGEVKLLDFGLASSSQSADRTDPSSVTGKLRYLAPEQVQRGLVDRRSDLYALGLVLYELVSGSSPYEGVPAARMLARVASPAFRPLAEVDPRCPPGLSAAVMKALAPEPAHRFQTAEEFRTRLQSLLLELDPLAGAETTSQLMHEVFATEYQAERKALDSAREQARSLVAALQEPVDGRRAAASGQFEALSFAPTRRPELRDPEASADAETRPAISTPVGRGQTTPLLPVDNDEAGESTLPPGMPDLGSDSAAVGSGAPTTTAVDEPVPPELLDGPVQAQSQPTPKRAKPDREQTRSFMKEVSRLGAAEVEAPVAGALSGASPPPAKLAEVHAVRPPAARPNPPSEPTAKVEPEPRKGSQLVWMAIPLLAVLGLGAYIAWDVLSERLQLQRREAAAMSEARAVPSQPASAVGSATRAKQSTANPVSVTVETGLSADGAASVPGAVSPDAAVSPPASAAGLSSPSGDLDDEPLSPLPTEAFKKSKLRSVQRGPPRGPAPVPQQTAAHLALSAMKADFNRLGNEDAQGRFRMRVNLLSDREKSSGDDPVFIRSIRDLHDAITAELAKPKHP
jgi:hypothetical protein